MKNLMSKYKLFVVIIATFIYSAGLSANTIVNDLKCEYHINPVGIDIVHPRLSWKIVSEENNIMQTAYELRVAESEKDLTRKNKLVWSTGKVESDQSVNIVYEGPELESMKRVYWQIRIWDNEGKASKWSEPAFWEMGILQPELWTASWITKGSEEKTDSSPPAQYFRNEFSVKNKVQSARVYVTSLGLYELYLNGEKVGDQLFTPGWTSYNKRLQYQVYDVSSMLKSENAIGAILGDGWYKGNLAWQKQRCYYGDQGALMVQLVINFTDGTSKAIVTDKNWKVTSGPILKSDIYNGETYDARLEMKDWAKVGFSDNSWESVSKIERPETKLVAYQGVPVRAVEEIKPIEQITTPKGEMVFDMGQNMVGWVRIKLRGERGDKVVLKFAEVLDKEGNFYTANLRGAECTDTYIFKGDGEEIYEPKFTFHGFRFLKIEGLNTPPALVDITGVVIHSDMTPTGNFTCSNELINQLQHNIQWGQKGNFLDVPTDCPQRDERLGWTGDAQVFAPTAAFNFDVAAFYTKWTKDITADQLPNGIVPHVIPDVLKQRGGSTAWADAAIIVPWTTYLSYDDKRILEVQYPSMKAWVEYMRSRAGDDNLWIGDTHYGDWLAFATNRSDYPGATTEKDLIATAYYSYSSGLLAKIAAIIGENDDAKEYKELSDDIKKAFVREFVTPAGRLVSNTQTAYCLAISFELLPENLVSSAIQYLADDVKKMGHLTTGFVGTPLLCKTLSDQGHADLAFMLLNRKQYPSWLYPVTQGATTIWERWDGKKPDGTFQNVGMNSFNHYAYGAIGEWMYNYIAGIQIDEKNPGYKHFMLAPHPGGDLTNATATHNSMYGEIKSAWKIEDGKMQYNVVIPANTTATVTLPNASLKDVMMNAAKLHNGGDAMVKQEDEGVKLELGSGQYSFSYPL